MHAWPVQMPPRSFLEVIREPMLCPPLHGVVLQIPVKLDVNLQCPALD